MSWQEITGALTGALVFLWGLYLEIRMRNMQDDNAQLRRQLDVKKIEAETHAESDDDLRSDLNKFVGGGPTS